MNKYEVDVKRIDYGLITIEAENEEDAIEQVKRMETDADVIWSGTELEPIEAREAYI